MDKVEYGVPATPEQVAQHGVIHALLEKRIWAIFHLWKQRRERTTARWAIRGTREWSHILWWCIGTDSRKPEGELEVMAEVDIDYECTENWCFPLSLLYVKEEELEQAVAAAFRAWVNEERKRMPPRPAWTSDPEEWETDDEMEPADRQGLEEHKKTEEVNRTD